MTSILCDMFLFHFVINTDSSLKDGLFHEYKKHGKVTMVKVVGQGTDRFAVVCFKKPEDVDKALVESKVSVCNNIWDLTSDT